ncbi:MAG: rod shape-determining protein MreC, partial [Clostridia bacterium]
MKLKVPKTERRRSNDSKARHIWRRVLLVLIVFVLLVLSGLHLLGLITGNKMLALPENAVATVLTPVQTGFSTVVDWVVEYFYKVKLRARIELEYNNLRQENEQLVYQAMLAEELQKKLTVYENLFDEVSLNESMNPLVATVIGRESGNYFSVFTLNKGAKDGITNYMAVTVDGALVGYT